MAKGIKNIQRTITELGTRIKSRSGKLSKSDAWSVALGRRLGSPPLKRVALQRPTQQDLHLQLQAAQDLLSSVYSVSLLGLRGHQRDERPRSASSSSRAFAAESDVNRWLRSELQRVRVRRPHEACSTTSNLGIGARDVQPCQVPSPERPLLQASRCTQPPTLPRAINDNLQLLASTFYTSGQIIKQRRNINT